MHGRFMIARAFERAAPRGPGLAAVLALALAGALATSISAAQESERASGERAAAARADERAGRSAEADPLSTTPVDEEVVVRGQLSRGALRVQIEMAEEAFFSRFNDINSDDEFDIHCRRVVELGSRIPRRRCEPNFWRTAQADYASDTVIALQGGFSGIPEAAIAYANHKNLQLNDEVRELAARDPELREALARLATLRQAYAAQGTD